RARASRRLHPRSDAAQPRPAERRQMRASPAPSSPFADEAEDAGHLLTTQAAPEALSSRVGSPSGAHFFFASTPANVAASAARRSMRGAIFHRAPYLAA